MKLEANVEYVVYNDSIGFRGELTKERLMIALKGKPAETLVSVDSYQEDGIDECWITTRWITKANEHGQYTIDDLLPGYGRQERPDAKTTYYKATGKLRGWGQWIAASACDNGFTTWDHLYPLTLGLIYWPSRAQCTQRTEAQPEVNSFDPRVLNRKGWTCGCEPGNYDSCDECQSACNELANFLNRPEVKP